MPRVRWGVSLTGGWEGGQGQAKRLMKKWGGPFFLGGVDPSRDHVLKKKNLPFREYFTSLY